MASFPAMEHPDVAAVVSGPGLVLLDFWQFDMAQPMLGDVLTLFTGLGLGAPTFQALLPAGFPVALGVFGAAGLVAAAIAVPLFRTERPRTPTDALA